MTQIRKGLYDEIVTPQDRTQLSMPLKDFLINKKTTVEEFNYKIENKIKPLIADNKRQEAYIEFLLYITYYLEQTYGIKLPYTFGGEHYNNDEKSAHLRYINGDYIVGETLGVNPNWGYAFNDEQIKLFQHSDGTEYKNLGLDCSSFISFGMYNVGIPYYNRNTNDMAYGWSSPDNKKEIMPLGELIKINKNIIGVPGDIIYCSGHVMTIIKVDCNSEIYYTAEAHDGQSGVVIRKLPFENLKDKYFLIKTKKLFENPELALIRKK